MYSWRTLCLWSSAVFLLLAAFLYLAPESALRIDTTFTNLVAPFQTVTGISLFLSITILGGGVGIIAVAAGFAFIARLTTAHVFRLIFLLGAVTFLNRLLKELFARTRPETLAWFDEFASFSFPSAHASAALALYGFIAVVLYARTHRQVFLIVPGLVILLVGLSRIILGAHYLTDVLGGYLLGLALLALVFLLPFERAAKRYG